jgi:hypothetical protein
LALFLISLFSRADGYLKQTSKYCSGVYNIGRYEIYGSNGIKYKIQKKGHVVNS